MKRSQKTHICQLRADVGHHHREGIRDVGHPPTCSNFQYALSNAHCGARIPPPDPWRFDFGAREWGRGGGGGWGSTLGLPGGISWTPNLTDLLPDFSECSSASSAFLPSCGLTTINGIQIFSFDPEALGECHARAGRELRDKNVKGSSWIGGTGLIEGAEKIVTHIAVEKVALWLFGGPAAAVIATGYLLYEAREVPGWLYQHWDDDWDYTTKLKLCDAAFK